MIKIRKSKRHGVCNSCGQQQTDIVAIWEVRASVNEKGWNTMMLCDKCVKELQEALSDRG